jgi:Protein of unknown function (DUF3800)
MRRRRFLKVTIGLLGFTLSPIAGVRRAPVQTKTFRHDNNDLVLDQSGIFGTEVFVLGILSCKDFSTAISDIKKLRTETSFRCKLSYSSRNKWKAQYAKQLIDYWINGSDLIIDLLVIKSLGKEKESALEKMSRYTELVSRLIDMSKKGRKEKRRLVTQQRFSKDRQDQFEKLLISRNKGIDSILKIAEDQSDLLQLLDLIVGSTYISYRMSLLENLTKKDLLHYLEHRLGAKSLTEPLQHPKCSIPLV